MLILLASWILLVTVSLLAGMWLLPEKGQEGVGALDRAVFAIWSGLALLAAGLLVLAMLTPLRREWVVGGMLGVGLATLLARRTRDRLAVLMEGIDLWGILLVSGTTLLLAVFCSGEVTWFDTGLYHHQMTTMLAEYGVLKGAALVHQRFGFSSSWFALGAIFPAQTLGGLAAVLVAGHLVLKLYRMVGRRAVATPIPPPDWFIVISYLLLLPFLLLGGGLALSPSPDVPAALLTIIIAWWIPMTANHRAQRLAVLLLGGLAFSIKLSTLPILGVVLLNYLVVDPRSWPRWAVAAAATLVFAAPLVMVNVLTSGCPLYPAGTACLEQLPWGMKAVEVEKLRILSSNFARTEGRSAEVGGFGAWFLDWIIDDLTGSLSSASFLTIASMVALLTTLVQFCRRWRSEVLGIWGPTLLLGLLGTLYVIVMAPTLRFGIGYFIILPALALAWGGWRTVVLVPLIANAVTLLTPYAELEWRRERLLLCGAVAGLYLMSLVFQNRIRPGLTPPLAVLMLLAGLVSPLLSLWLALWPALWPALWLSAPPRPAGTIVYPAPVVRPGPGTLEVLRMNGFSINLTRYGPLKNQCWDAPRLCTPDPPEQRLRLLDQAAGVRGGLAIDR